MLTVNIDYRLFHLSKTHPCTPPNTHTDTPTWPGIQSEDTIYTRVYSVFVPAFKARTNLCITHSKWGHFFTHLWTCLARTKRGLRPYPPTPISWQREDSAHSHKARTEILTSLCQNVLTLNVKNWFWSSLWMPGRTHPINTPHSVTTIGLINTPTLIHPHFHHKHPSLTPHTKWPPWKPVSFPKLTQSNSLGEFICRKLSHHQITKLFVICSVVLGNQ